MPCGELNTSKVDWLVQFGGSGVQTIHEVMPVDDGFVAVGWTYGMLTVNTEIVAGVEQMWSVFAVRLDSAGEVTAAHSFVISKEEDAEPAFPDVQLTADVFGAPQVPRPLLAVAADDRIWLTGPFSQQLNHGSLELSPGPTGYFLVALSAADLTPEPYAWAFSQAVNRPVVSDDNIAIPFAIRADSEVSIGECLVVNAQQNDTTAVQQINFPQLDCGSQLVVESTDRVHAQLVDVANERYLFGQYRSEYPGLDPCSLESSCGLAVQLDAMLQPASPVKLWEASLFASAFAHELGQPTTDLSGDLRIAGAVLTNDETVDFGTGPLDVAPPPEGGLALGYNFIVGYDPALNSSWASLVVSDINVVGSFMRLASLGHPEIGVLGSATQTVSGSGAASGLSVEMAAPGEDNLVLLVVDTDDGSPVTDAHLAFGAEGASLRPRGLAFDHTSCVALVSANISGAQVEFLDKTTWPSDDTDGLVFALAAPGAAP